MAEYIGCRECDSLYCKGCNLKNLETMLCNGKFDCIMNENRCINTAVDVALVIHGHWVEYPQTHYFKCSECKCTVPYKKAMVIDGKQKYKYCPNCGATMDKQNEPEN